MDLHKFTTAQLYIMHRAANDDARRAYALAEHKSIELLELATVPGDGYAAAEAEFCVLMAQADDHRAYSRQIYDEIVRRSRAPQAGGTTGNGTRYCRTCGFTDCPGAESGDCPRWPARETTNESVPRSSAVARVIARGSDPDAIAEAEGDFGPGGTFNA